MPGYSDNSRLADAKKLGDYLTCGQCAQEFPLKNITNFIQHKTENCEKYPIHSTFESTENRENDYDDEYSVLSCSSCYQDFATARGLLHHVQFMHKLNIFQSRADVSESELAIEQADGRNEEDDVNDIENVSGGGYATTGSQEKNHQTTAFEEQRLCTGPCCRNKTNQQMQARAVKRSTPRGTTICCNSQECCVTIIPGTHEEPRKCCKTIVPKKRKLHMVKHMNAKQDSAKANEEEETTFNKSSTIYIDVGSRGRQFDDSTLVDTSTKDSRSYESEETQMNISDDSNPSDEENSSSERGSVIIKTGERFSIPITVTSDQRTPSDSVNSHSIHVYNKPLNLARTTNTEERTSDLSITTTESQTPTVSKESPVAPTSSSANLPVSIVEEEEDDDIDRESGKKRRYPTSRPYKCEECNDAFNQRIHLKKHMSKHTGVKPFKCQQCDYSTVERSHLKVHIRIHTGEKPFKCNHCEYATAQNSTLKIHLKRRHGGKMFQCDVCSKVFTQQSMLETHLTEHQKDPDALEPNNMFLGGELQVVEDSSDAPTPLVSATLPRNHSTSPAAIATGPAGSQAIPSLTLPLNQVLSLPPTFSSVSPMSFSKLTKSS